MTWDSDIADAITAHKVADDLLNQGFMQNLAAKDATIADLRQQILDLTKITPVQFGANFGTDPDEHLYPANIEVARLYFQGQTTIRNEAEGRAYKRGVRFFIISTKSVSSLAALVKTRRSDCTYVWIVNHEPEDDIFKDKTLTLSEWHSRQVQASKIAHDVGDKYCNLIMTGTLTNKTDNRYPEDFVVGPDVADYTGVDVYPKNFGAYTVEQLVGLHLEWQKMNGGQPLLVGEFGVPGKTRPADSLKWTREFVSLVDKNPYAVVCYWSQGENVFTEQTRDAFFQLVA